MTGRVPVQQEKPVALKDDEIVERTASPITLAVSDPGALTTRQLVKMAKEVAKANSTRGLKPNQERFCQLRAIGETQIAAYTKAGYEASTVEGARAAASKLNQKPHIKKRIEAIKRDMLLEEKGALQVAAGVPDDEPRPIPTLDPDVPELATNDFDPRTYSKEWLARQAVVNLNQARSHGKLDAANGALKFLAELGGHIEKGTSGRKQIAKAPNKGELGYGEADDSTEGEKQVFNFVIGELDRAARLGDEARDVTPESAAGSVGQALSDERGAQPTIDVDELTRELGEGVPIETGD